MSLGDVVCLYVGGGSALSVVRDVVVVTGSSGLIGSRVVRALAERFRVVGFDRTGDPHPPVEAECVCVDLDFEDSIDAGFARVRYAYGDRLASIVHLAAYYDFSGTPSAEYQDVNVDGTARVLERLQSFEVEQFVYSSTMLVHAPVAPGIRITEESPLGPTWAYPESKATTERLIAERRGSIPAVLLRIAGGYDEVGHSPLLASQMRRIFESRLTSRLYPGNLRSGSAFVHLDDVVAAIVATVERRGDLPAEVPLLIGEEDTMSYDELQEEIAELLHGRAWRTYRIPKLVAKVGAWVQDSLPFGPDAFVKPWMVDRSDDHYVLDTSAARKLLDWEPEHSLRTTLPDMAAALLADPVGWYEVNGFGDPPPAKRWPTGSRRAP